MRDNLHRITNVKNLLEYSDDFSRSVGKNSFWYLDTDDTTANTNTGFEARRILTQAAADDSSGVAKSINEIIPLNRYSFFETLEERMLPPMQLSFEITLNHDSELIHMANGTDAGRIVVKRFYLWLPRLIPNTACIVISFQSFLSRKPGHICEISTISHQIQQLFRICFKSIQLSTTLNAFLYISRGQTDQIILKPREVRICLTLSS